MHKISANTTRRQLQLSLQSKDSLDELKRESWKQIKSLIIAFHFKGLFKKD